MALYPVTRSTQSFVAGFTRPVYLTLNAGPGKQPGYD